jgi:hypothetical protein
MIAVVWSGPCSLDRGDRLAQAIGRDIDAQGAVGQPERQ